MRHVVGAALACMFLLGAVDAGTAAAPVRVTVFGDSAATAVAYDPAAKRILGRGIDLRLEVAACRRLGDLSCPYDGERPPNVIDRATALGEGLGKVVVVVVGYNDYETRYAQHIADALAAFRKAGVERVLWATLRAERQSYLTMNEAILEAGRRNPAMTVLDWNSVSRGRPDWIQGDGIHLTDVGAQAMARLISDSLVTLGVAPPRPPVIAIAPASLPVARDDRLFVARLRVSGGAAPYRWSLASGRLPAGVRLAPDGRLRGTPGRAGTFRLRVRVIDRTGASVTRPFALRVVA